MRRRFDFIRFMLLLACRLRHAARYVMPPCRHEDSREQDTGEEYEER